MGLGFRNYNEKVSPGRKFFAREEFRFPLSLLNLNYTEHVPVKEDSLETDILIRRAAPQA